MMRTALGALALCVSGCLSAAPTTPSELAPHAEATGAVASCRDESLANRRPHALPEGEALERADGGPWAVLNRFELPKGDRRDQTRGRIGVLYVVGTDGAVLCADASDGHSAAITRTALRTIAGATFAPLVIDGEAVPFSSRLTVRYGTR